MFDIDLFGDFGDFEEYKEEDEEIKDVKTNLLFTLDDILKEDGKIIIIIGSSFYYTMMIWILV
jgi:hypothetical protein